MLANASKTTAGTRKQKPSSGLVIPAMVAALLMAAALVGCDDGSVSAHENGVQNVGGLPAHAEAVGQDNGSLTDTFPTASEYERLGRRPGGAPEAVDRTPRVDARYVSSER